MRIRLKKRQNNKAIEVREYRCFYDLPNFEFLSEPKMTAFSVGAIKVKLAASCGLTPSDYSLHHKHATELWKWFQLHGEEIYYAEIFTDEQPNLPIISGQISPDSWKINYQAGYLEFEIIPALLDTLNQEIKKDYTWTDHNTAWTKNLLVASLRKEILSLIPSILPGFTLQNNPILAHTGIADDIARILLKNTTKNLTIQLKFQLSSSRIVALSSLACLLYAQGALINNKISLTEMPLTDLLEESIAELDGYLLKRETVEINDLPGVEILQVRARSGIAGPWNDITKVVTTSFLDKFKFRAYIYDLEGLLSAFVTPNQTITFEKDKYIVQNITYDPLQLDKNIYKVSIKALKKIS